MGQLTPSVQNFDLGNGCVADVLYHPDYVAGVTPWMFFRHGGALAAGDHYAIWPNGGSLNAFATHLFNSSTTAFSICSLGTPQYTNAGATPNVGYLDTIVNSATGVTFTTSPSCVDRFEDAVDAAIAEFTDGAPVILAATSAGCFLAQVAMCRGGLPATVKGYLGYYPIPDVRKFASGGDKLHHSVITGLYGTSSQATWDAVSAGNKAAASFLALLESGPHDDILPCYFVMDRCGNHLAPYGDPSKPGSAPHDTAQFAPLLATMNALVSAGSVPAFQQSLFAGRNFWETQPLAAASVHVAVESWMAATAV